MTELTASCAQHAGVPGLPCARCGTFGCTTCLEAGLCQACATRGPSAPSSETVAGFGVRAAARILDLLVHIAAGALSAVPFGVVYAALSVFGRLQPGAVARLDEGFGLNVAALIASVVSSAASTTLCGATVGKLLLGLRVVALDGARPGFGAALIRELAYLVDALFFGLIGKAAMDSSPLSQRHGDRWASTAVVRSASLKPASRVSGPRLFLGLSTGLAVYVALMATAMVVKVL